MTDPAHIVRSRTRQAVAVLPLTLCLLGAAWYFGAFASRTPIEVAYDARAACDISHGEVDQWVYAAKWSRLDRAGLVRLFEGTLDDPADGDECRPCLEAVLRAAGRP